MNAMVNRDAPSGLALKSGDGFSFGPATNVIFTFIARDEGDKIDVFGPPGFEVDIFEALNDIQISYVHGGRRYMAMVSPNTQRYKVPMKDHCSFGALRQVFFRPKLARHKKWLRETVEISTPKGTSLKTLSKKPIGECLMDEHYLLKINREHVPVAVESRLDGCRITYHTQGVTYSLDVLQGASRWRWAIDRGSIVEATGLQIEKVEALQVHEFRQLGKRPIVRYRELQLQSEMEFVPVTKISQLAMIA